MYAIQYVNEEGNICGIDVFNSDDRVVQIYRNSLFNEDVKVDRKMWADNPDDFFHRLQKWIAYTKLEFVPI